MKIAMIGQKGIPAIYGGVERHVEELAKDLTKLGHDVLVYARSWYTPKNIKNYKGITVIHTPTIRTKHLDTVIHTLTSTIHALWSKVDVIHYHGVGPSLFSWIPRLVAPKTKVIVTFHCIDRYHQKWGVIARMILALGEWTACNFPHETIAVSKTIQNYCLNEFHKNTIFIPNGVRSAEKNIAARRLDDFGLEKEKYILMVSRLVPHKGAHYLVEAWKMARRENMELLKDYKLAIVGGSAFTDDYVEELKKFARSDKSVVFTGWQKGEALQELYAHTLLLVHPSENEGLPLTVLSAMAHGRAALVSDIPEHKEVITDRHFWFTNADVFSLTHKIQELLKNKEVLELEGEKNRYQAREKYGWPEIAAKTTEIYMAKKGKESAELQTAKV